MSEQLKRLFEKRNNAWEQAKEMIDLSDKENREFTAEENQKYLSIMGSITDLDERMLSFKEAEQRAKDLEESVRSIQSQPVELAAPSQEKSLVRKWFAGESGRTLELRFNEPVDFRTLSKLTSAAGGNTVRTDFLPRLYEHLIEVSGIMQTNPTVLNTDSGEALVIPKTTAHSTASLVAEAAAIPASDPAFGQVSLGAYKYGVLIQTSNELLTDTSVDLEGYLARQAGRALGNAFGAHAITGTGTAQPTGVVTAATTGVTGGAGVGGAPTASNLIDLFYSVIAPYRNSPSAAWLMRDATVAVLRKLTDSNGQYMWQPGLQAGEPSRFLDKPVYTDPNVPAVGLGAKSVVFGDFSAYYVRMVNGLRFERSDDYAFNTDLVSWRALLRADGNLIDTTGAIKVFVGNAA